MSRRKTIGAKVLPPPANDNTPPAGAAVPTVHVLIFQNLPIREVEVEVFAALLDDWPAANDNENL